jgi:hypothetical protein
MKPAPPDLLFGPYRPPPLRKGDRVSCLDRDCDVVITGWKDAPIGWPLCRPLEGRSGAASVLVEDELVRAIRHESASALHYWWGVCFPVVHRWRRNQGVGFMDSEGSRRLIRAAAAHGADCVRGQHMSEDVCAMRRHIAIENGHVAHLGVEARPWAAEELALLGTDCDRAVAARIGRTESGVRQMRTKSGIPPARRTRSTGPSVPWAAEELALLGTDCDRAVAARIGRTEDAVLKMRSKLGIPPARARRGQGVE